MKRPEISRVAIMLLILGAIVAGKLTKEFYDWYAYGEERATLEGMLPQLGDAGFNVVLTQLRADSMRSSIEGMDRDLSDRRTAISAYDRYARNGRLSPSLAARYRRDLEVYNQIVTERNEAFERWKATVLENHEAVERYNRLADRIRAIAALMGEQYYPLPTPAEIAVERGIAVPGDQPN
ncbi:MAG TPA: hypothetical protein VFI91_12580 [Longimicrobiaceae bacterium]|nr:hypothetical protein [Longimicrobiaceae bacterium]